MGSSSNVNAVIKDLHEQELHHGRNTFAPEFISLLKKHCVPYEICIPLDVPPRCMHYSRLMSKK